METVWEAELRGHRWLGIKPLLARAFTLSWVNFGVRQVGRHLIPKHVLHRFPVAMPSVDLRTEQGRPVTLLQPLVDQVAKDIYWGGGRPVAPRDDHAFRYVERIAGQIERFLDIGAYSGAYALLAARSNPALKATTYEIVPENQALIEANIVANGLGDQVDARLAGLGAEVGAITMPLRTGTVSRPSSLSIGSRFSSGVKIPISTLDLERHAGPLAIKIDVEGFEWEVVRGGVDTLRSHRPDIVCEILPTNPNVRAIQEFFDGLGYRYHLFLDSGLENRSRIEPTAAAWNWLLTTRTQLPL